MVSFLQFYLSRMFSWFYPIRNVETRSLYLAFKIRQISKELLFGWHNVELLAVAPASTELVYVAAPAFLHDLKSLRWFLVTILLCVS